MRVAVRVNTSTDSKLVTDSYTRLDRIAKRAHRAIHIRTHTQSRHTAQRGERMPVVYVLTSEPRKVYGKYEDISLHGKDLLGFPYSACDIRNFSHDRLERRSFLRFLLFV